MNLPGIWWQFDLPDIEYEESIKRLIAACPWLKYDARAECAAYYECDPASLKQTQIKYFLRNHRDYDGLEVSKIVSAFKEE